MKLLKLLMAVLLLVAVAALMLLANAGPGPL